MGCVKEDLLPRQRRTGITPRVSEDHGVSLRIRIAIGDRSLREIGRRCGVNAETLRRYAAGESPPRAEFLRHFGEVYELSMDWLLLGIGPMDRKQLAGWYLEHADVRDLCAAIGERISMLERAPATASDQNAPHATPVAELKPTGSTTIVPLPNESS